MGNRRYPEEAAGTASSTGPRIVQPGERVLCAVHETELVCPGCIGAAGGKSTSKRKLAAAAKNARRPRPGARGKKKPRRAATSKEA